MSSWARVEELFQQALEREPGERASFVAAACGDDVELLGQVSVLLEHDSAAPAEFMVAPVSNRRRPDGRDETAQWVGRQVGRYEVEEVIAVGGMGTVFLARQADPERHVALKLMRRDVAWGAGLRRFDYESRFLARLHHPHIAQVYECGTYERPDGAAVPYFAMEHIESAQTITAYAAEHNLSIPQCLDLFQQACDAVHHGHQRTIIHRDLKPANILVNAEGHVKVIDFGVARSTDSDIAATTLVTDVGQLIGTLQYMSPEQCAADPHDIDTRSDVYSLGVVLYELLCGRLPYTVSGSSLFQASRTICDESPVRPRTVSRTVAGDLETIVLTALEKDREKRYQSASALADDIGRYLRREPIAARAPSRWTRATRWVINRPFIATTAACVAMLAGSTVATLVTIYFLNQRPHHIEVSQDRKETRLFTVGGKELHTWTIPEPGRFDREPRLVKRPPAYGGGSLAILGVSRGLTEELPSGICAFDTAQPAAPLWTGRVDPAAVPSTATDHSYNASDFSGAIHLVDDIFGACPGPEVVASHHFYPYSQTLLRIYSLKGEVLYEIWHDGPVESAYWLRGPRLLVLTGVDAHEYLDELGIRGTAQQHPRVVFAIRPALRQRNRTFLSVHPGRSPSEPRWYLALAPPECLDRITAPPGVPPLQLSAPVGGADLAAHVEVRVMVDRQDRKTYFWWNLDQYGNEVPGSRDAGDPCKRYPDRYPDPNKFCLLPFDEVFPAN